jgi:hypothetical protein
MAWKKVGDKIVNTDTGQELSGSDPGAVALLTGDEGGSSKDVKVVKATPKAAPATGMPPRPDTSGMSLAQAATANAAYKKAVDAWYAKQPGSGTAAYPAADAQAKALRKKE